MKKKWIKPQELPDDFWGECFVSTYDGVGILTEINIVKVINNKPFWYSEAEQDWFSFGTGVEFLVMVIDYPEVSLEDFK